MFFAETEGELTLGSPAAFAAALYVAGTAPNRAKLLPSRRKSGGDPPPSEREAVSTLAIFWHKRWQKPRSYNNKSGFES